MARQVNGKWQSNVIVNGQRIRKMFSTREEAEAHEADPLGEQVKPMVGEVFRHGYKFMWSRTRNWRDQEGVTNELILLLGEGRDVRTITKAVIQDLILKWRDKGNSGGRINRKLAALSKLLSHAIDRGIPYAKPKITYEEESEGRSRYLTEGEVERLFSHLSGAHQAFARFLLYTGCRVGEALQLRWDDLRTGKLTLRWETTKGKKMRVLSLPSHAIEAFEYGRALGWERPWQEVHYDAFHRNFTLAKQRAGLDEPEVVPHTLRHTCASWLVQRGVSFFMVSKWLGHSTTTVTMRYAHLAPDSFDQCMAALDRSPADAYPHGLPGDWQSCPDGPLVSPAKPSGGVSRAAKGADCKS